MTGIAVNIPLIAIFAVNPKPAIAGLAAFAAFPKKPKLIPKS